MDQLPHFLDEARDLMEIGRFIAGDEPEILSDLSNCPTPNKKFMKHDFLNQYFDIIDQKSVACKHCKRNFRNRHSVRLTNHIKTCLKKDFDEADRILDEMTANKEVNNLMTMFFIEANIPLSAVELKSFKPWIKKITSDWVPPSRRDISSVLIKRLSHKLQEEFHVATANLKAPCLSIEFDHWQDVNGRSLLGVIATTPAGKRQLLDLRDTSVRGHSANVIVEDLAETLKLIPSKAINSIVSDSASSCKRARIDLTKLEKYSHVIQHRCIAHLMNRVGQRITTKNYEIVNILAIATKITGLISTSAFWQATIQDLDHNKIKQACPTRWYSIVKMLLGLQEVKQVIFEKMLPKVSEENARIVRALDWDKLDELLEILKPINECIGFVEAKDVSLGQAFGSILKYARDLFAPGYCSEFRASARTAFLWHFSSKRIDKDELGLYLAAYVLDRRNKMNYITQDGLFLALEKMALIARLSAPIQRIKSSLIDEFENYSNLREDYAAQDLDNNPVKWWSKRPLSILMQVAIRLAHLKASSTNIERTFSSMKHIQGGSRMNLSLSSLVDIGRLKVGTTVIYDGADDDFDLTSYELQDEQQPSTSKRPCVEVEEQPANQSDDLDTSDITGSQEMSDWLETQDLEIVASFKWFFKHIDFNVISDEAGTLVRQSQQASEEQIRQLVQQARGSQNYGITIDSASQAARLDAEIVGGPFSNL